jgi:peptide-methionine (R)-S-oxide reductase
MMHAALQSQEVHVMSADRPARVSKTEEEWRKQLTPEQYYVTRQHGTERAFSNPLNNEKRKGMFSCVCCGAPLFSSETKFDSGTGWPSFWAPIDRDAVAEHDDRSWFMRRTEVRCAACDAHLGHVFPDGPKPTGARYCMNGVALKFDQKAEDR